MAAHFAIPALVIDGAADASNGPDVFMEKSVESLATKLNHPPGFHHVVAL